MNILIENWLLIALLVVCVGMHFFLHGHGGHRHGRRPPGSGGADPTRTP